MQQSEFLDIARSLPETERAGAIAAATKELPREGQQVVAAQGIDKGAWPQESRHRMITIIGSLIAALLAALIALGAAVANAEGVATGVIALATAIVGGIFGYSQASK